MTTIKKYRINNLDCANCAMKIERSVQEFPGVRFASVDFATATLHLDADDPEGVNGFIQEIEPGVDILPEDKPVEAAQSQDWGKLGKLGTALALLIVGIVFESQLENTPYHWGEILVFGLAYLLPGWGVLAAAVRNIRRGNWFDEAFLMSVATLGAVAIGEFPEAVVVMLFYQIGEYVQGLSVARTRRSIEELMDVRPETAHLKLGDEIRPVRPEEISVGQYIVVKPGERVPLDGVVAAGESLVDTAALTGESVPRTVKAGSQVLAGMINKDGMLEIEVQRVFSESSVSKLLELVQNAVSRKSKTQRFITRFAQVYSPVVVGVALGVAFLPPLFIPGASLSEWVYRALVILVISCPCALVISIPIGYFGGVGGASKRGILVKGANFLDVLADVRTVVFDKTGTLTRGVFKVAEIHPQGPWTEKEMLQMAAQAEAQSNHPVAQSIRQAYGVHSPLEPVKEFEEKAGFGVRAQVNGYRILAGNAAFLELEGIQTLPCDRDGTVVHLARNDQYAGCIHISDEMKADSKEAVAQLHRAGVEQVVMLTGDHAEAAEGVAAELGLDRFFAGLLPEDKLELVERLLEKTPRGKLAFVGDGINDAPSLARADVGIAMGAMGADAAIEVADVVLMTDAPSKVAEAIEVGKRTRRIVWQNIGLAFVIKALFIALGIAGSASMWEAVFADVGVTLLAVFNAARVLK